MSAVKAVSITIVAIIVTIMVYYTMGPVMYTSLDALNNTVYDLGTTNAKSKADFIYSAFYYGFGGILVLAVVASIIWLYLYLRREWYSSEGVVVYG